MRNLTPVKNIEYNFNIDHRSVWENPTNTLFQEARKSESSFMKNHLLLWSVFKLTKYRCALTITKLHSLFFSLCCLYKKRYCCTEENLTHTFSFFYLATPVASRVSKATCSPFLVNVSEYIINCLVNAQIRRIQKVRKMALLHRFLRLNDQVNTVVLNEYMEKYSTVVSQADTGIFTFVVTRSVTRDLHRDVTSKEFT